MVAICDENKEILSRAVPHYYFTGIIVSNHILGEVSH